MFSFQLATMPRRSHGEKSTIRSTSMKTARTLTTAFVLLTYGAIAIAADSTSQVIRREAPKGITTTFYTCIDKAGSDTIAIGACLSTEKTTQDARLNTTYKALLGKLHGKAKDQLISAERAWLKFQNEDGTFQNLLYGDEIIDNLDLTQNEIFSLCRRANELDRYLSLANGL
ncbi:lysozyme inhibitor LprI family protein [Rhodanobacter glycinis]|nr:lysozyme inhibitor LprI family protein [Rhodanobacter glycinis]